MAAKSCDSGAERARDREAALKMKRRSWLAGGSAQRLKSVKRRKLFGRHEVDEE